MSRYVAPRNCSVRLGVDSPPPLTPPRRHCASGSLGSGDDVDECDFLCLGELMATPPTNGARSQTAFDELIPGSDSAFPGVSEFLATPVTLLPAQVDPPTVRRGSDLGHGTQARSGDSALSAAAAVARASDLAAYCKREASRTRVPEATVECSMTVPSRTATATATTAAAAAIGSATHNNGARASGTHAATATAATIPSCLATKGSTAFAFEASRPHDATASAVPLRYHAAAGNSPPQAAEASHQNGHTAGPLRAAMAHDAEVLRLRDDVATARHACSEELAALRAESLQLRGAQQATEREAGTLRRRAEADRCEIADLRAELDAERTRSAALASRLAGATGCGGNAGRTKSDPAPAAGSSPGSTRKRACRPPPCQSETDGLGSDGDALVTRLAEMELGALAAAGEEEEERVRARRRLQAKWHPDKNSHNAAFATRVLHEMQRRPEWHQGTSRAAREHAASAGRNGSSRCAAGGA
eukprot:NODE_8469_length_1494_cov_2.599122.p1 GENE.NODE_8469_length_1494_cov_2.599122~~NODE_8469_length_1494_cov_2.599122.p1  ORF type:complete len:475 (-),score=105.54 NODE_8469_length_1494_cov_2.599122:44-1468(-)